MLRKTEVKCSCTIQELYAMYNFITHVLTQHHEFMIIIMMMHCILYLLFPIVLYTTVVLFSPIYVYRVLMLQCFVVVCVCVNTLVQC